MGLGGVENSSAAAPVPDFISINREINGENLSKSDTDRPNIQYGVPKATFSGHGASKSASDNVRKKRKRESSPSGDHFNHEINGHDESDFNGATETVLDTNAGIESVQRMPWHPGTGFGHHYSKGIIGLHEEIEDFYQWMKPTPHEHYTRLGVVRRISNAILKRYPGCRVDIFGSFRTGLYLPTSDIDLVIFGKWEMGRLPFGDLSEALRGVAAPGSLLVLERAAVPIIKLADDITGIRVDISFNMANGLRAAELIKHFKKRYPVLPKLIYVLKQFLYQRDLNEVYSGGLSSYALILMVVSFLQQHVREDAKNHQKKPNLGVLLVEFFELYGLQFNYTSAAIRITNDGAYLRKDQAPCYQGGGYGTLCIEDPYDVNNDVGKSSYGFPNCKKAFVHAYFHILKIIELQRNQSQIQPDCNNLGNSLLSQLINVKDDLLKWREHLASCDIIGEENIEAHEVADLLPSKEPPTETLKKSDPNPVTSSSRGKESVSTTSKKHRTSREAARGQKQKCNNGSIKTFRAKICLDSSQESDEF